ncbi:MAG: DUF4139 domain-containing protein [Acidobacteriota bacterium]
MRILCLAIAAIGVSSLSAADLPIREVTLYKHGVGYFSRSGALAPGDSTQLDFKSSEMNDVLKSLTIRDASGAPIGGVRYDASEPVEQRLAEFPFANSGQASLAAFLDQMKGSRLELRLGADTIAGAIVSARSIGSGPENRVAEKEVVVLLTDANEIRSFDLGAATALKLADPKLQIMMRDYLTILGNSRSRDLRSVHIDATGTGSRQVTASYMTPTAVWKSSYRLIFPTTGDPTLEGWAIVDNTSGDDWSNIRLSVVSGRPISFITQLYEPRYVDRPRAELAENRAVGPQVFEGGFSTGEVGGVMAAAPPAPAQLAKAESAARPGGGRGGGGGSSIQGQSGASLLQSDSAAFRRNEVTNSSINVDTEGRDLGELFEYSFATPVTVKRGESAMLPFLQEKVGARKLIIYSESFGLHPMNAAEITNATGKTLDGGPITVYDAGAYSGEALVETLKTGDKRLISYGVDLGTRVTTKFDSTQANVREIHLRRGILTSKSSIQETKTYTLANVDAARKTVIIEHGQRPGYTLIDLKAKETTSNAYRFEVALAGKATDTFAVKEERVYDQNTAVSNMSPDVLTSWIQNKALSSTGKLQLERIAAKKAEISANANQINQTQADTNTVVNDQGRFRSNIGSLNNVAGQQALVQQYAKQLADSEARLATLRDQDARLKVTANTLQGELNRLIESADF